MRLPLRQVPQGQAAFAADSGQHVAIGTIGGRSASDASAGKRVQGFIVFTSNAWNAASLPPNPTVRPSFDNASTFRELTPQGRAISGLSVVSRSVTGQTANPPYLLAGRQGASTGAERKLLYRRAGGKAGYLGVAGSEFAESHGGVYVVGRVALSLSALAKSQKRTMPSSPAETSNGFSGRKRRPVTPCPSSSGLSPIRRLRRTSESTCQNRPTRPGYGRATNIRPSRDDPAPTIARYLPPNPSSAQFRPSVVARLGAIRREDKSRIGQYVWACLLRLRPQVHRINKTRRSTVAAARVLPSGENARGPAISFSPAKLVAGCQ